MDIKKLLKTVVVIAAAGLLRIPAYSLEPVVSFIEISGGALNSAATYDYYYNDDYYYYDAYDVMSDYGSSASFDISAVFVLEHEDPFNVLAPYIRAGYIYAKNKTADIENWYDGTCGERKESAEINFFTAGLRYYWGNVYNLPLNLYAGTDAGIFTTLFTNPCSTTTYYDPAGHPIAEESVSNYTGNFFGINIEMGIETWISEAFGLHLKAGLRGHGHVHLTGTTSSTNPYYNALPAQIKANYSGSYITGGVNVRFWSKSGETKRTFKSMKADDNFDAAIRYIDYGDAMYRKTKFKKALKYYDTALGYYEDSDTYNKIAKCLYFLKRAKEAYLVFKKAYKLNPDDIESRGWIEKLEKQSKKRRR